MQEEIYRGVTEIMDYILAYSEKGKDFIISISINMKEKLQYDNPELKKSIKLALNIIAKCFKIKKGREVKNKKCR